MASEQPCRITTTSAGGRQGLDRRASMVRRQEMQVGGFAHRVEALCGKGSFPRAAGGRAREARAGAREPRVATRQARGRAWEERGSIREPRAGAREVRGAPCQARVEARPPQAEDPEAWGGAHEVRVGAWKARGEPREAGATTPAGGARAAYGSERQGSGAVLKWFRTRSIGSFSLPISTSACAEQVAQPRNLRSAATRYRYPS